MKYAPRFMIHGPEIMMHSVALKLWSTALMSWNITLRRWSTALQSRNAVLKWWNTTLEIYSFKITRGECTWLIVSFLGLWLLRLPFLGGRACESEVTGACKGHQKTTDTIPVLVCNWRRLLRRVVWRNRWNSSFVIVITDLFTTHHLCKYFLYT